MAVIRAPAMARPEKSEYEKELARFAKLHEHEVKRRRADRWRRMLRPIAMTGSALRHFQSNVAAVFDVLHRIGPNRRHPAPVDPVANRAAHNATRR